MKRLKYIVFFTAFTLALLICFAAGAECEHLAEIIPGAAPTCTEDGLSDGTKCSICGEILSAQSILPAAGHTEETIPGTESSCTQSGKTDGIKCSVCDAVLTAQTDKPLKAHTPELVSESNTSHATYCVHCGKLLSRETHIPGQTYSDDYNHFCICDICGELIASDPHRSSSCSLAAGCDVCGRTDVHCERPAHNMAYIPWGTNMVHYYRCTICEYTEGGWIVCRPACTKPGICTMCGGATASIPFHPYTYPQWDSTHHWDYCQFCDTKENYRVHTVSCATPGKCSTCAATDCTNELTHGKYVVEHSDSQHWEACANCGAVKEGTLADHNVSCQNPGTCTKCGAAGCTNAIRHALSIYLMNYTKHWRNCTHPSCDYIETEEHTVYCRTTTCTVCNTINCKNDPIHRQEEVIPGTAATCTQTGMTDGKYCQYCKKMSIEQTVIPAKGHSEITLEGKAASCTATGLTEGRQCIVCSTVTTAQSVIPASGHTETILPATEATCTVSGMTPGKQCTVCGTITVASSVIPAFGHTESILPAVEATCAKSGLTEGKMCSVCSKVIVAQQVIPALGHEFGGDWLKGRNENHHQRCVHGCGQFITADCEYLTVDFEGNPLAVCPICGRFDEETAELITSSYLSIPVADRPGMYIARCFLQPISGSNSCIAFVTAVYERSGVIVERVLFEDAVTINIPLPTQEVFRMFFAALDPKTQQPILHPIEHTTADERLFFTANQLGLFLLVAE